MTTDPFDFSQMMKLFDPNAISKVFDPEQVRTNFSRLNLSLFDFEAAVESNKKNLEAIQEANKAAVESYRNMYEMQMAIFDELTKAAQLSVESLSKMPDADRAAKQQAIYQSAVEKAFSLMAELANSTREANQEVFALIEDRIKDTVDEIKSA